MVPSRLQLPPPGTGASATTRAGPPDALMVFNLSLAKNPRDWLSADQKGEAAPSVPGRNRAEVESRGRTQSIVFPFTSVAEKARACPSGESTGGPPNSSEKVN